MHAMHNPQTVSGMYCVGGVSWTEEVVHVINDSSYQPTIYIPRCAFTTDFAAAHATHRYTNETLRRVFNYVQDNRNMQGYPLAISCSDAHIKLRYTSFTIKLAAQTQHPPAPQS